MKRNYIYVLLIVLLFNACEKKQEVKVEKKEEIKNVFVLKPKIKEGNENRVFSALATSDNQIKLSFKVQGNLNSLKVQLGQEVKKGEKIASLDAEPYKLRVSQAKFALSEAKASLDNAKNSYERTKKLYVNQNASISDIDNTKASYNAAFAKLQNVKKELEYAKLQESYTKLYAPQDGFISRKFVQENENVNIASPIVLLSDKLVDEVKLNLPESYINKIKQNEKVSVKFISLKNKIFKGKINDISKFASNEHKTYEVIIKLEETSSSIKSGMSADVYFTLEKENKNKVLTIASNSVLNDEKGYFTFVVKDSFIKRKNIKVAKLSSQGYEITEGLTSNDLVLKAGMFEVFEGMKVEISNLKDLGQ